MFWQRSLVAALIGVCILSAAIGAGIAMLAQTGPAGPAGKRGPVGPRGLEGPEGESAAEELSFLEAEIEDLREQADRSEAFESRVEDLESELSELGGTTSELCEEIGFLC